MMESRSLDEVREQLKREIEAELESRPGKPRRWPAPLRSRVVSYARACRELGAADRAAGEYLRSHALQSLAVEIAEAAAERLHRRLRELWGFPDPPELSMKRRFRAAYRGKRYSPGYAACPDLDQQRVIWRLLDSDEIGVSLTDGMMMDPEASVSAFVFHHPDCVYFSATGTRR